MRGHVILSSFGFENGSFGMVEDTENCLMAILGSALAWIFTPLGWGKWQCVAAAISGFSAKEAIVSTMGVLANVSEDLSRRQTLSQPRSETGSRQWQQPSPSLYSTC